MSSADSLLEKAEKIDSYRFLCNSSRPNQAARYNQVYAPTNISDADKLMLKSCANRVPLLDGCDIIILDGTADSGFPHTRPEKVICLPISCIESSDKESLEETLAHEALHIHQRLHRDLWLSACKRDGWTPLSSSESIVPKRYWDRRRLNPDTLLAPLFAWEKHMIPLPLFKSETSQRLSDVAIKWYDTRSTALLDSPPSSFSERYGTSPQQPEHPYELLAVELAKKGVKSEDVLLKWLADDSR